MAQSINPGLQVKEDSAAIAREFVRNAKPILDSLTKLHFIRLETILLKAQLRKKDLELAGLAKNYKSCTADLGTMGRDLTRMKEELGREKKKQHTAQTQKWVVMLTGIATTAFSIYISVR